MSDSVADLLTKNNIYYTISGKDYVTKCFNPAHTDTHPSFRIDKLTGIAHCFSCGWKMNIFKHYGVLTTNNVSIKIAKLKDKLREISENTNGVEMLEGAKPYIENYRGITPATYKQFGAFTTDSIKEMEDRVILPLIDIRGKIVAFVGRHLLSNTGKRYNNFPAGTSLPLFPAKLDSQYTSMILVEGIFDLLNLYDKGLKNTVCTFGTAKLYNDTKEKLHPYKVMGIEKIYILFDGDDPGREAAKKLKPLIEEAGFLVEVVNLPDGVDPGSMDIDDIHSMDSYVNNKELNENSLN